MSADLATNTLNSIYSNTFQKYLMHSDAIGGIIYEQSLIVNNVFNSTVELIQKFHSYKKPLNPLAEQYLTDPLFQEIEKVKSFEGRASDYIFQITLISKSIKLFEWVREMDVEKFVTKLNKYVQFYQQKAHGEIESLNRAHVELVRSWNETYEEFSIFLVNYFKNGVEWSGIVSLPINYVLGDTQIVHQAQLHQALFNDINKGFNDILRYSQIPTISEEPTDLQKFSKEDQKWFIKNQKDNHKDLMINTARKEDCVFIYNCVDCTIVIENLINLIHMQSCEKLTILFRETTKVESVNCKDCNFHCFDKLANLKMVSCEDCGIFISDKSFDTKIVTTKCAGVTVQFPFEDGLYQRFQISDQLITRIVPNRGIETTISKK